MKFSASEAAEYLGICRQRVHQLAAAGRIPCERTMVGFIFDVRDLAVFAKLPRPVGRPRVSPAPGTASPAAASEEPPR